MSDQRTRAEKFADWLNRRLCPLRHSETCAKWLHGHRAYLTLLEPMHCSYNYQQRTGITHIPAGEEVTIYYWRGQAFRFWRGECTSIDSTIEEGHYTAWRWSDRYYGEQGGVSL